MSESWTVNTFFRHNSKKKRKKHNKHFEQILPGASTSDTANSCISIKRLKFASEIDVNNINCLSP